MQNFNETQGILHPQRANSIYIRFVCFCFVTFAAAFCLRFRLYSTLVRRPSVWNRLFVLGAEVVKHTNKFLIKVETKMKWKSIFSWHTAKLSANIFDLLFPSLCRGCFFIQRHSHIIVKLIEERAKQANRIKYETMAIGTKQSRIQSKRSTTLKLHKFIYSRLFLISHCLFIYVYKEFTCGYLFYMLRLSGGVGEQGELKRLYFPTTLCETETFPSIHSVFVENVRCCRVLPSTRRAVCSQYIQIRWWFRTLLANTRALLLPTTANKVNVPEIISFEWWKVRIAQQISIKTYSNVFKLSSFEVYLLIFSFETPLFIFA